MDTFYIKAYNKKIEELRSTESNEFQHLRNETFLDFAANSIYPKSLILDYYEKLTADNQSSLSNCLFSNPHSKSQSGQYTNMYTEATREKILNSLFNTNSNEYDLIFVNNATDGLKKLAQCFVFNEYIHENDSNIKIEEEDSKPIFAYFKDNHTSVIGMREIVWSKSNSNVYCLGDTNDDIKLIKNPRMNQLLYSFESKVKRNLLVYPGIFLRTYIFHFIKIKLNLNY
jgi:hypothetical protein